MESKIISAIDQSALVDLTRDLVKIPSVNPPGEEKAIAEFIASWFEKRNGFDVAELEVARGRPNIIVNTHKSNAGEKQLIFNGHTDVVPSGEGWTRNPFGAEIEETKMFGRGVADMKGALAAMMIAMDVLNSDARDILKGSITLIAAVDEEKGGYFGTNQVVKRGISGDFAIVGEPTEMGVAKTHKGNLTFEVTTFGKAAHASAPKNGINAVMKMNAIISELKNYSDKLERNEPHPLLGPPTFNIGTINGGMKSNVVPDSCKITAERRLIIPEKIDIVKEEIKTVLSNVSIRDPELKYAIAFLEEVGASEMPDGETTLSILLRSLHDIYGKMVEPSGFAATCDAYYLNDIAKIPTAIIGPGSLRDVHKPDESVEIESLFTAAKVYALTALRLLSDRSN